MLLHILHPDWWLYFFRDSLLLAASTRWWTVEASQIARHKYMQRRRANLINNSTLVYSCFIEQIYTAPFIHKHTREQERWVTLMECQSQCNARVIYTPQSANGGSEKWPIPGGNGTPPKAQAISQITFIEKMDLKCCPRPGDLHWHFKNHRSLPLLGKRIIKSN